MGTRSAERAGTEDREIVQCRVFDASQEPVWRARTEPEHIAQLNQVA